MRNAFCKLSHCKSSIFCSRAKLNILATANIWISTSVNSHPALGDRDIRGPQASISPPEHPFFTAAKKLPQTCAPRSQRRTSPTPNRLLSSFRISSRQQPFCQSLHPPPQHHNIAHHLFREVLIPGQFSIRVNNWRETTFYLTKLYLSGASFVFRSELHHRPSPASSFIHRALFFPSIHSLTTRAVFSSQPLNDTVGFIVSQQQLSSD